MRSWQISSQCLLTLNPPRFLELTLSAPEVLSDQEAIAERLDRHAARIAEIRLLKTQATTEVKALSQAIINNVLGSIPAEGKWGSALKNKPRNGWSPKMSQLRRRSRCAHPWRGYWISLQG